MAKKKGGRRTGAGRPEAYPGEGRAVRRSFSAPESLAHRLRAAAQQIGATESAVVVAAVRAALAQSPDRLAAEVASSGRAADADALTTHTAAILPLPSCGWESAIAGLGLASQTREPHR